MHQLTDKNSLYDLCCEPKIMDELRTEIATVLAKHNNELTARAVFDMTLLDAVCKESQRLNPADLSKHWKTLSSCGLR